MNSQTSIFQKILLLICLSMGFFTQVYTGEDDGKSAYFYGGIPGCGCFYHCRCYSNMWDPSKLHNSPEDIVWHTFHTIIPLYKNILSECTHKGSYNLAFTYNEGLLSFVTGDYETSFNKINEFVLFAEALKLQENLLNSKIYQKQGESQLEVGLYHEAITALTKSIQKDPTNKESYFIRASAFFEIGEFASAISDYLASEIRTTNIQIPQINTEFNSALLKGMLEGGKEAAVEFVPSLCNTAHGLGKSLWCFTEQPLNTTTNFCYTAYKATEAVVEYFKNLDQEKLGHVAEEIVQLYNNYDSLNDSEKGNTIGYCIGKYGVDIFAGAATFKCVSTLKNLKTANRTCNLEAMVASSASNETMVAAAMQHAAEREAFFKNLKIHWGKQGKHIPKHNNYETDKFRSVFLHDDPQELLTKHSGKGIPKNKVQPGTVGYVERVDFEEFIGFYIDEKNPTITIPTTKGTIKYSKDGAHIVPSHPEG